jgi:hypothetical protein
MVYVVWDYWRIRSIFYCLVYKEGELYFSEAKIPENLEDIDEPR